MTMSNEFDPHAVPPFPVFTIRQAEDGADTLDGVPIEPAHDEANRERAATDAVAQKAAQQGHDAVRVRAHLVGGRRVDFVVRTTGEVYDTTTPDAPVKPSRSKRALILTAAGLTGALILGGGAFVLGHTLSTEEPEPVAATPTPPPGYGTEIPVGLPDTFTTHAAWTAEVNEQALAREMNDGRILTLTADRTLAILDPETGEAQWVGSSAPTDLDEVHETTWQGRPVLAAASSQSLSLWPLDDGEDRAAPVTVPLEASADVTYAGSAPLVDLGDYTVLAPATQTRDAQRVTLPPGAVPAAVTDGAIRSISDEAVWSTDPETEEHEPVSLDPPQGAEGSPEEVIGLSPEHALAQWPQKDSSKSTLALIDLSAGTVAAHATVTRPPSKSDPLLADADAQTAVIGDVFVSYGEDPALVGLDGFDATAIEGHRIHGTEDRTPVTATVTGEGLDVEDYPLYSPEDPSPVLVTDEAAYVVHTRVDQTYLYRADRTPAKEPTP